MKKVFTFWTVLLCLASNYSKAATYVWVGPLNGNWNDAANWALDGTTTGGAGVPGPADAAFFSPFVKGTFDFAVNVNTAPTIRALYLATSINMVFYTSQNTTMTVTQTFSSDARFQLDSTIGDVKFDLVLQDVAFTYGTGGPTHNVRFAGKDPVSSGNGAGLTLNGTSSLVFSQSTFVTFAKNSGALTSTMNNLRFNAGSGFILENKLDAAIPAATWDPPMNLELPDPSYMPAPYIQINGDLRTVKHLGTATYGALTLNLNNLSDDANLALPNGTVITGNLTVLNTNGHTLTLLDAGAAPAVTVTIQGSNSQEIGGYVTIGGATSKVALANASVPTTSYKLDCRDFNQTGGNFSLQDANNYTGTSALTIRRNLNETGGTFITNSTSTGSPVRFVVELLGPEFFSRPSGPIFGGHSLTASSGSLDNPAHMVTLRMSDVPFSYFDVANGTLTSPIGVFLKSPVQVGKLELNGGPIFSTTAFPLTVANPAPDAVKILTAAKNSYISGPVRRMTNAATPYMMPTGKGTQLVFNIDTCAIIPVSAAPSVYQAEYFNTRYADTAVTGPFRGVDTSQYWDISKVSGADAQVQLFLTKAVPQARAIDNIVVAHYVGGQWTSEQGTILSPGNVTAGSVSSKVLSSFSPFTFGYGAFTNAPLAIHMLSFDGHAENGGTRLNWKVAEQAARFEVLRSADGVNFSQVGIVQASAVQQQYTYLDSRTPAGNNFYRLQSVEKNGAVSLSDVIMVNSAGQLTELMTLAPTVVRSAASLRINAVKAGQMQLVVTDMAGRSWKKLTLAVSAGSSANLINLSELPAGTYQISGYMDGIQTAALRFVKQ